jgi:hypothetical protein
MGTLRARLRVRQVVNLANGSTLAGLGVAAVGGAAIARSVDGLFTATGYRLAVPPAPAFCLGNVIVTRREVLEPGSPLFRHEARHATQFAWCGGVVMIPLYLASAGASWVLTGDFGSRNVFERRAGLADGGYPDKPLRHFYLRVPGVTRPGRSVTWPGRTGRARVPSGQGRAAAGRDGSTASPSR